MKRHHKQPLKRPAPVPSAVALGGTEAVSDVPGPILDRPDGYYWQDPEGRLEFGPFESYEAARLDRDRFDEERLIPGETLQQAESEVGIADWIDAETGEPAEGQSPPHLEEE